MKHKKSLLFVSAAMILASCGGGSSSSSQGESSIAPTPGSSADTPSSSAAAPITEPTYQKAAGEYTFPTYTTFVSADQHTALEEHRIVVFCPVSAGYKNVYNWTRGTGGDAPFADWPGTPMATKYDDKWFQVSYEGYDDLWIIFNGSGQTADMHMDHDGYWWFWESDGDIHDSTPVSSWLDSAAFADGKTIRLVANTAISSFKLYEGEKVILQGDAGYNAIDIDMHERDLKLEDGYSVEAVVDGQTFKANVATQNLYTSDAFNAKYAYEGDDLGLTYSKESSTFKVWSPLSSKVVLKIYGTGTPASYGEGGSDDALQTVEMTKGEHGVYSAKVEGDLAGKYYTYSVTNKVYKDKEICDPYARSSGINGIRGMILDLAKTNPDGWDAFTPKNIDRKALTVYESHIADLTSSSTWNGSETGRKKFAGFHESGTTHTLGDVTVKTGFDHIKELGVNAVQILPMFDQANDERVDKFNWGYNPLNYNIPEGLYSSNPYDGGVRVRELKELILAYGSAGINIIMDVVYNHVAGAIESNFDVLFPGYFYRYNANGSLANGSGCGNETASDHYMFRKFMIDSVAYWTKEYKLGGFRFDLMGLHDVETMNLVTAKAKSINPGIVIYGEPWQGGTSPLDPKKAANQVNGNDYVGYGQFNDGLRDALIKGGLNAATAKGWATGLEEGHASEAKALEAGIKGFTLANGTINDPDKTVNYVACHDNYTLHDRVAYNYNRGKYAPFIKKMAILAQSVVFTSQGTSFMLSGDEFLREKKLPNGSYDHNSYESPYSVNELNWDWKVQNLDHFEHYKKLIALKQSVDGLHLDKDAAKDIVVEFSEKKNTISYEIQDKANNKTYKVAHQACWNAKLEGGQIVVADPGQVDFTGYREVYLNTFDTNLAVGGVVTLEGGQTIIAVK